MWPAVMDTLSRTRVAWMLFNDSRPVSWSDGVLAVAVDSPGKVANAFPVEKFYRDSKLCTIGEGTSEIQKLVIARKILE